MNLQPFLPGLVVAILFGLISGAWAGRHTGSGTVLGTALMSCLGIVVAVTLTPGGDGPRVGPAPGTCDLARFGLAPLADLTTINEVSLNIALLVPLGIVLGMLPRSGSKLVAVATAFVLPFVIETVQLIMLPLGRYCDSADVADNLTGLILGLLIGTVTDIAITNRNRSRSVVRHGKSMRE